jgi:hypothetical protein
MLTFNKKKEKNKGASVMVQLQQYPPLLSKFPLSNIDFTISL